MSMRHVAVLVLVICVVPKIAYSSEWNNPNSDQYHIQTDEGNERYFRYQTHSGQYRKEKRLEDGTVIGSYAWIDDDGFLRQRDYIADNAGYRILKTKNLWVGRNTPIAQAMKSAKKAPAQAGTLVKPVPRTQTAAPPLSVSSVTPFVEIVHNSVSSTTASPIDYRSYSTTPAPIAKETDVYLPPSTVLSTPRPFGTTEQPFQLNPWYYSSAPQREGNDYRKSNYPYRFQNGPTYPIDSRGNTYTGSSNNNNLGNGYDPQYEYYDGVSVTNDGFRYYIPRAYHEEQISNDKKTGSFGYIDPFGIRRVIYYNAGAGGFQHRKNNRYVGFDATPYDPRPY